MPEIAEVARIVHFIRKLLVGKKLVKVTASEDNNVFGKVGTSAAEFEKHMTGKKVVDAGQQGKYFWMIMSSPPHPVMHFGMAGWLKFKSEHSYYYKPTKHDESEEWPPKYMKFLLETDGEGDEKVEAAFVDFRRFARIRLVDCPADQIRKVSPLIENGPDPVIDRDVFTVEWLKQKCHSKKVPIKAMLLDQVNISGIGNWVGDEVMYHAKMHPEQYANTLSDEQIKQLHTSIHHICKTATDLLGDSDEFPEDWLFKHRWSKGKKGASNALPNGEKIAFLTVGGRTSAVVPSVQKKTGPVAGEMDEAVDPDEKEDKPKAKGKKRKAEPVVEDEKPKKGGRKKKDAAEEEVEVEESKPKVPTPRKRKAQDVDEVETAKTNGATKRKSVKAVKEDHEENEVEEEEPAKKGRKPNKDATPSKQTPSKSKAKPDTVQDEDSTPRRRSGRNRG